MALPLTLYTASQVRELDRIAIEDFAIPGFNLMRQAAQVTFDCMMASFPDAGTVCIVCGTGNNGGDGYLVATLAFQAGLDVSVIQLGNDEIIKGDALLARQTYLQTGETVLGLASGKEKLAETDIIIDAIFGTGLARKINGEFAQAITSMNQSAAKRIAVDIPSGLNADTGSVLGCCVKADKTVTYIGLKCGLFTGQARDYVGDLVFDDLDVPYEVYKHVPNITPIKTLVPNRVAQELLKPRARCSHKGDFGHVLCIGGAVGMSGAIRLCAEAALRAGAGLVTVATHPLHAAFLNLQRPEIMVSAVSQADEVLPLMEKASVIIIGPGLGKTAWANDLLALVLMSDKPKVLDADALNLLAEHHITASSLPGMGYSSFATNPIGKINDAMQNEGLKRNNNWIITPHPAEAARLLITKTALIEQDRYQSVELLQQQFGGVCVLKGAGSLISDGEKTRVCQSGNPGMATAGMGDVLSGIIGALVAQAHNQKSGSSLFDVATVATNIHGKAADIAAQQGEKGMIASDLFPVIRQLVNEYVED